MYTDWSSCSYWENITIPIVFINSTDDPLVPQKLVEKVKLFVNDNNTSQTSRQFHQCKKERLLIEQKFGGHLGFYEGGLWKPSPLTWLDRTIICLADSLNIYVQYPE